MKKILLIADSDRELLNSIKIQIEETTDMYVVTAHDGLMAAQKAHNQKFDAIACEWELAKLAATSLVNALRETINRETPLIIHTNKVNRVKKICKSLKSIGVFPKPMTVENITSIFVGPKKIKPASLNFSLKDNFVAPLMDITNSTMKVITENCQFNALIPYEALDEEKIGIDISGVMKIKSKFLAGTIAISFSDEVYLALWKKLKNQNNNQSNISVSNEDWAAELIQKIITPLQYFLNKKGFKLDYEAPTIMRGLDHQICHNSKIPKLLVPFNSDAGKFYIQIFVNTL